MRNRARERATEAERKKERIRERERKTERERDLESHGPLLCLNSNTHFLLRSAQAQSKRTCCLQLLAGTYASSPEHGLTKSVFESR